MAYLTEHEKKRKKIGWIVFLSILLTLSLTFFAAIKICRVETMVVEGNELYDDESIRQWVLNDKYCWNTVYVYLKYRFFPPKEVPFIDTMTVSMTGPKSLSVLVYEKGLIGYLVDESLGQNIYFDKDGFVIDVRPDVIPGVSEIRGLDCGSAAVFEKLPVGERTLRTLLTLTQTLQKYGLTADVIEIDPSGKMTVAMGTILAKLGNEEHMTEKVIRLQKLVPQLVGETGILHLENWTENTTDVSFERQ